MHEIARRLRGGLPEYGIGDFPAFASCNLRVRTDSLLVCLAALAFGMQRGAAAEPPRSMLEDDWRKQDGIGTPRAASTYAEAIERTLRRGDLLLSDLENSGSPVASDAARWRALREEFEARSGSKAASGSQEPSAQGGVEGTPWEDIWRRVHELRRKIVFSNPLARTGPLLFAKQVPSIFSHQLTQYYGSCARPGGGLFVLDAPGESLDARTLVAGQLPPGSYQHPEVTFDGRKVLFAYCRAETTPSSRESHLDRFYHLHECAADGSGLRQLTDGPYDDFSPKVLPGGKILFISTRRGGFHRCGRGPCAVYTLATCNPDGSDPRPVSYHETHEWDPAVLHDGRIVYTRWDYVDRNAVFYENLWSVRPDGSDVRIFYGNNTLNPVGIWEARPVPGSRRVMATAAAHHAMTAGSIVLLDVALGVDGPGPIVRLTPDALFPESEAPVAQRGGGAWHAPAGVPRPPEVPIDQLRWPGHCYRTPYPLSEKYFLVAYSFDALLGEPDANPPGMFGLYLADRFGNKELIHRDPDISSLWPVPLGPRPTPPALPSQLGPADGKSGTFLLQDVRRGWPSLPPVAVKRLRIVEVLLKTTPHANDPPVGVANASPGKEVLGTVPVEPDGSAYFRAPAGIPLSFQALDERGEAVQIMRSVTYLQPGESAGCIGCHEARNEGPPSQRFPLAFQRGPSEIEPAPDGSSPLCYPILVQPVLDARCVTCHGGEKPAGGMRLTGEPQGRYTISYNALAPRVAYSDWAGRPGDFREVNSEPMTRPGFFGARASPLGDLLRSGHHDVSLSPQEWERLVTWMDANALFYGSFQPADQARQLRGERIERR